jgi:AcrR family transcriptional regulator
VSSSSPRRERILQAAERLFRHYGPAKTTMAEIARASGVGVGSLYLDFASKDAILGELGTARVRRVAERMREAGSGEGSARERLVRMLEARVVALFDVADEGRHACDLLRCNNGHAPGASDVETSARSAESPAAVSIGFGAPERALLLEALAEVVGHGDGGTGDGGIGAEHALNLLEIAFAALTPPQLYRLDRQTALVLASGLARAAVYGLGAATEGSAAQR